MKYRFIAAFVGVLAVAVAQQAGKDEPALAKAIQAEMVDGNLKSAIDQYRKLSESSNKSVAARALVRLGECYEKQGSTDARKTYEQVVSKFGDQKDAVAEARVRLAALGGTAGSPGMSYRQLWSGPNVDTQGRISADGRYLPYVDWDTGDLALHDFSTGADRHLTDTGTLGKLGTTGDFAEESVISKDGRQIVYAWYKAKESRYELRIAPLPASGFVQPRTLFDSEDLLMIAPSDWSPDGKWLAVWVRRHDRTLQAALLSTQDGSLRVLSTISAGGDSMHFSPDGRYLGFDHHTGSSQNNDVFIFDVGSGAQTAVVTGPGEDEMMGWSPDGKSLLFDSDRTGTMGLWSIPVADGKPAGAPVEVRPDIPAWSLGMSASGALYVGSQLGSRDLQIASFDLATGKLLSQPAPAAERFIGTNTQPAWSADSKYLAWVSARNTGDRVIAIRSLETGEIREIRPNLKMFNSPRWSPDGNSFVSQGNDGQHQGIFRIDAATGGATAIVLSTETGKGFQRPQPSPDGKRIFYFKVLKSAGVTPPQHSLVERDLASGNERELLRGEFANSAISPDGNFIATAAADVDGRNGVIRLDPTGGGEPREIIRDPMRVGFVAWAPDSRGVIVRKSVGAMPELWLLPVGTGDPRRLDLNAKYTVPATMAVSPDGRHVVSFGGEPKYEVWVLENFLPAAKAMK